MCHDAYCLMFLLIFPLSLLLHIGVLFHQSWFHVWPAPVFVVRADNLSCPIATLWKDKKISFILPKDRSQVAIDTAMVNNIWRQTRKFGKTFLCTYCTIKWSYSLRVVIVTSSRVLRDTLQTTIFRIMEIFYSIAPFFDVCFIICIWQAFSIQQKPKIRI